MTNRPDLDNELADMTDRLLSGQDAEVSSENRIEALLVRRLYHTISRNPAPDATFRSRLTQRINQEWNTVRAASSHLSKRPLPRWAAPAAALVVVVGATLILLSESALVGSVQATAVGPVTWVFPAIFIGAIVVVGFTIWRRRK
jgi:hypothetical protein